MSPSNFHKEAITVSDQDDQLDGVPPKNGDKNENTGNGGDDFSHLGEPFASAHEAARAANADRDDQNAADKEWAERGAAAGGAGSRGGEQRGGQQRGGEQRAEEHRIEPEIAPGKKPKMTELDYQVDPLARLERNNRSTKQAIAYFFAVPGVAAVIALATAFISRSVGGPYCEDPSAWLCTQGFRLFFHIAPAIVCFVGLFGAAFICYYKWARHQRWRPWIAVIWFLMPIAIGWATNSGAVLILNA